MKKLLTLSLLVSFAQAHCNTEPSAQPQPNIVQLTEEEKMLCTHISNYEHEHPIFAMESLYRILTVSCGLDVFNQSDSYDSNKHPECESALRFLKVYAQRINDQREQNEEFAEQFYDKMKVRLQETSKPN